MIISYLGNLEMSYLEDAMMSLQKEGQGEPGGHCHITIDICAVPFKCKSNNTYESNTLQKSFKNSRIYVNGQGNCGK